MIDTIASAVVELGKLAVVAYAVHFGGQALLIYVQRMPTAPTEAQAVDAVRRAGYEVNA